jgi:ABC-2 type transport system permease protein
VRLAKAELRRLFKRRLTRIFLVVLFFVLAAIPVSFIFSSQPAGPAQRAAAEVDARRAYEQVSADHARMVEQCQSEVRGGLAQTEADQRYGPNCGQDFAPQPDQFRAQDFMPYEFNFRQEFSTSVIVFAGLAAMVMFVVGASFVGAEWNTGGMMNLLLWRPRRLPVLFTKLAALLGGVLAVTVVLGALWTVAFWLIGRYDGTLGGMTPGAWRSFALSGARGVGLILVAAAVGFGLASIGRHTAMALGVVVGVLAITEIGLRIVLALAQVPFGDRFLLTSYAAAWFDKRYVIYDYRACNFAQGVCNPGELVLTWQQAGAVFGIGAALVLIVAFWSMQRRDIT